MRRTTTTTAAAEAEAAAAAAPGAESEETEISLEWCKGMMNRKLFVCCGGWVEESITT